MPARLPKGAWPIACLGALLGCGSKPGAQSPPASAQSGSEVTVAEQAEPTSSPESAEEAPAPTGPAVLTVEASVRGAAAAADVRLLAADGSAAGTGHTGEPISVPSGEYTLEVTVTDEKALVDKPTQRRSLTLHPGDSLRESVEFPWAMIQLNVRVNGSQDNGALVEVKRQGEVVAKLKSGADPVPISPGRYDADVKTRGTTIAVQGLMFPQGGTQSMPVNVQM